MKIFNFICHNGAVTLHTTTFIPTGYCCNYSRYSSLLEWYLVNESCGMAQNFRLGTFLSTTSYRIDLKSILTYVYQITKNEFLDNLHSCYTSTSKPVWPWIDIIWEISETWVNVKLYYFRFIFTETANSMEVNRNVFALHMCDHCTLRPKLGILDSHDWDAFLLRPSSWCWY